MKNLEKREQINVEDLRERIDELLRLIKEKGEIIEVTEKGKVIAQLTPPSCIDEQDEQDNATWEDLTRLSARLSASWPKDVSAADAIRDVRRDFDE